MHRQFLNAEPALFTLLLHRLSPESLLLLCFPLDLILYPGSSQGAPPPQFSGTVFATFLVSR